MSLNALLYYNIAIIFGCTLEFTLSINFTEVLIIYKAVLVLQQKQICLL